jgi:hypothetical protein
MKTRSLSMPILLCAAVAGCGSTSIARRAGSAAADGPGSRALAVVRIARPWYAPRFVVRKKFREALPEYEREGELDAKYFTIADDGRFGGLYLWKSRGAAESHFDAAWRAGVRERRGVEPDVLMMDAPYLIEGPSLPRGPSLGARSLEFPASASFVELDLPPAIDPRDAAAKLAASPGRKDDLIRAVVVVGPHSCGIVALWADRAAAESATSQAAIAALQQTAGASGNSAVLFEAPLLLDASLR